MELYNIGIILQIVGFSLLLFYKKQEFNMQYNHDDPIKCILGDKIDNFAKKYPRLSVNFLPFSVFLIIGGLILQFTFLNNPF